MLSPWRLASEFDPMAVTNRLKGEFHDWFDALPQDRLDEIRNIEIHPFMDHHENSPISHWPTVERFLKDKYPAAHRGFLNGREDASMWLDHPNNEYEDPMLEGDDEFGSLPPPEPYSSADHQKLGYDPQEVAAGMVLLHNRAHSGRQDSYLTTDKNRLVDIYNKRQQMQRAYEQRQANRRVAMPKKKPVYFALNPNSPGHAMAYWGDRYEPIAEVKWTTKGKSGYSPNWEPTPGEQGSVDWVWSHPHARRKGITKSLLEWVRDNHEPNLHGSLNMTPHGKSLSEALGHHVEDADWNRLQPVRGYERPINDAPSRMVDKGRGDWEGNGRPGGYI